jgi:hypothetical protein
MTSGPLHVGQEQPGVAAQRIGNPRCRGDREELVDPAERNEQELRQGDRGLVCPALDLADIQHAPSDGTVA